MSKHSNAYVSTVCRQLDGRGSCIQTVLPSMALRCMSFCSSTTSRFPLLRLTINTFWCCATTILIIAGCSCFRVLQRRMPLGDNRLVCLLWYLYGHCVRWANAFQERNAVPRLQWLATFSSLHSIIQPVDEWWHQASWKRTSSSILCRHSRTSSRSWRTAGPSVCCAKRYQ